MFRSYILGSRRQLEDDIIYTCVFKIGCVSRVSGVNCGRHQ